MCLIDEKSEMSLRQVANEVGISNGSACYASIALIEKRFVELESLNKNLHKGPDTRWLISQRTCENLLLTDQDFALKRQEFNALSQEISVLEKEVGEEVDRGSFEGRLK